MKQNKRKGAKELFIRRANYSCPLFPPSAQFKMMNLCGPNGLLFYDKPLILALKSNKSYHNNKMNLTIRRFYPYQAPFRLFYAGNLLIWVQDLLIKENRRTSPYQTGICVVHNQFLPRRVPPKENRRISLF